MKILLIFRCLFTLSANTTNNNYLDLAKELKIMKDKGDGDISWFGLVWFNPIYPTPLLGQDMTQGQFLSGV